MAGIGQHLKKIYSDETRIVENASLCSSVPLVPSGGFFALPGGPVTAKKSERAPYSHSFGAACYTAPVIKDLFSSEGTRTLSWATY